MEIVVVVYNTLMIAALCVFSPLWVSLVRLRVKYRETFFSRLWMQPLTMPPSPGEGTGASTTVWIHALSVGEVLSAEPLVRALARRYGSANLVFTASTHTGVETANRVIAPHVRAVRHFPYDTLFSVSRALDVIRPQKVVIVETDLWPNFLYRLNQDNIPVYLVNARLSGRSLRGYRRIAFLMVPLFSMFRRICVQAQRDRRRFLDLGLPGKTVVVSGNLKFDQTAVSIGPHEREQLQAMLGFGPDQPVWVAGSTHPGEEEMLGQSLQQLRAAGFDLSLVVAPRDPGRAFEVCAVFRRLGIQALTLGQCETTNQPRATVVVIDRIGILRKLYALADVTFVGGSLVEAGGHNPLEPASVARPVLFGPHTDDFDWISRTLEESGAAMRVANAQDLSSIVGELLSDSEKKTTMGQKGLALFNHHQGAVVRTMAAMEDAHDVAGPHHHQRPGRLRP